MTYMPPFFEDSRRRRRRSDRVVRKIMADWAFGMALGATFAALTLALDVLGLRSLLWRSDVAVPGTLLFVVMLALTFGSVVAAGAAMRAGGDDDEPRGGLRAPALRYAVVRPGR